MNKVKRRLLGAALGAAAYFAMGKAHGAIPPYPPGTTPYATSCVVVDATTVEGFVTNQGPVVIQVSGPVRFSFTVANSMTRPAIQTQSAVLIPPGLTASVGRAQLAGSLLPSESCRLDVTGALH